MKLIISSAHRLAQQEEVDFRQLSQEKFVHYHPESSTSLHSLLENACHAAGFTPHTVCVGSELLTIINLVKHNVGISIMPQDIIEMAGSEKLKSLHIRNQALYSSITMVWVDHFHLTSLIQDVMNIVMEQSQ